MYSRNTLIFAAALATASVANVTKAATFDYSTLQSNYSRTSPAGFKEAMKRDYGEDNPNSCAIRLAFALEASDSGFFSEFRSRAVYENKPIRARELADYLAARIPGGISIPVGENGRKALRGQTGIIYFANIRPRAGQSGVSWHISLWNGKSVVDEGDYFDRANSVQFWPLP